MNCLEPAVDYGLYDIATGERLDDVPAIRNGQRNLEPAVMPFQDGSWKVSDLQGQVDFACSSRVSSWRAQPMTLFGGSDLGHVAA